MQEISNTIKETQGVNLSRSSFNSYMTKETEDFNIKKVVNSPYIRRHVNILDLLAKKELNED